MSRSRRTKHRAAAHLQAHENAAQVAPPPEHPLIPQGEPELVESQVGFDEVIQRLRDAGEFALDSEFIGELSYYPKLCLVQVGTREQIFLIDPLANIDMAALWELVCTADVRKLVHAGLQDLEPAVRELDRPPANIFDTQAAAGFASLAYPCSLSRLIAELLGVKLGKGLTFSHWDQRPLSEMQLRYAADDVRYLPAIVEALEQRLADNTNADAAAQECGALCEMHLYQFDLDATVKRMRASNLPPKNQSVLRALVEWRDGAARQADTPPRAFLRDEVLIELSRNPVKNQDKLGRVKGFPRPMVQPLGPEIVKLSAQAIASTGSIEPVAHTPDEGPARQFRLDAVVNLAGALACAAGVDPGLFASRSVLSDFLRTLENGEAIDDHDLLQGWRGQLIGRRLLQVLRGESKATFNWNGSLRA